MCNTLLNTFSGYQAMVIQSIETDIRWLNFSYEGGLVGESMWDAVAFSVSLKPVHVDKVLLWVKSGPKITWCNSRYASLHQLKAIYTAFSSKTPTCLKVVPLLSCLLLFSPSPLGMILGSGSVVHWMAVLFIHVARPEEVPWPRTDSCGVFWDLRKKAWPFLGTVLKASPHERLGYSQDFGPWRAFPRCVLENKFSECSMIK